MALDELGRDMPLVSPVTPTEPPRPPSRLGADTDAVMHDLGYSPAEIEALRASGAIGQAGPST